MDLMVPDDERVIAWCAALQDAYSLARGERLAELRGRKVKFLDSRGLHPYTAAWATVMVLQSMVPELACAEADPVLLRKAAHEEAEDMFIIEIQEARDGRSPFISRQRQRDR